MDDLTRTLTLSGAYGVADALRLHVVTGDRVVVHDLPASGTVTIGRSPTAEVRLDASGVSRQHARLHLGKELRLEDLDSHNGTCLRERRLAAHELADLAVGDVFEIAGNLLLVQPLSSRTWPNPKGPLAGKALQKQGRPIVADGVMKRLHKLISRIGATDIPVLLLGESGVGKEVCARLVHDMSQRRSGPFVVVNCAALPESLVESELFGHERGAFSGADRTKPGVLESANRGTVLLDEVGELPLVAQAKLLRFLESGEMQRLGAVRPRRLDARVVSATNRDLGADVAAKAFRSDLYFRLNGFSLLIPPLRERQAEIEPLARHFLAQACSGSAPPLSEAVLDALRRHDWPGNIRELRRVIERGLILSEGGPIDLHHLNFGVSGPAAPANPATALTSPPEPEGRAAEKGGATSSKFDPDVERQRILEALHRCAGNQTRTAKLLGMSRRTLVSRLTELDLPRPRKKPSG